MNVSTFAGRNRQLLQFRLAFQRRLNPQTKRFRSSNNTPNRDAAPPSSNTIPGAGWAWIEPIKEPFLAYGRMQRRSPLLTQLSSSLVIYFLGDLAAQTVASRNASEGEDTSYQPSRGLRALVIGGVSAIPNYKWFMFLGNHFNWPSHTLSIAVKILINQTFFTPCFNTYFFGMQSLLSGQSFAEAKQRVVDTVPVSWMNSWKLWPAVTAFSFTFISPSYRSIFAGVIAIGWQTYLSWLNMKAQKEEDEKSSKQLLPSSST